VGVVRNVRRAVGQRGAALDREVEAALDRGAHRVGRSGQELPARGIGVEAGGERGEHRRCVVLGVDAERQEVDRVAAAGQPIGQALHLERGGRAHARAAREDEVRHVHAPAQIGGPHRRAGLIGEGEVGHRPEDVELGGLAVPRPAPAEGGDERAGHQRGGHERAAERVAESA